MERSAGTSGRCGFDQRGQFAGDVVIHVIVRRPGRARGIDIEARALAQIVAVRRVRHFRRRAGWYRA